MTELQQAAEQKAMIYENVEIFIIKFSMGLNPIDNNHELCLENLELQKFTLAIAILHFKIKILLE